MLLVIGLSTLGHCSSTTVKKQDGDIATCLSWIGNGNRPSWDAVESCSPFLVALFRQWQYLVVKDSVLCIQVILPSSTVPEMLQFAHHTVVFRAKCKVKEYLHSIAS